ncbi:hypothetical protein AB3U99_11545 [Niallia sp. JL1B1071]|uniref:hypothetical protein n=1 Tax=Niallia tiangongensis TaxID=3237105 RepID=UPI0037DC34B9
MKSKIIEESFHKSIDVNKEIFQGWKQHSFMTLNWWIGILLIIIPLLLWLKFRKKESADRLQYAGLIVALVSSTLDYVGTFFGKWKYDYEFLPATSNYIPFSFFAYQS